MLAGYLRIALRNLARHNGYAFINLFGLAIGLACCMLIVLWVQDELRYDTHHARADRIYRVVNERHADQGVTHRAVTPPAMGPALEATFPDVLASARLFAMTNTLVEHGERRFFEDHFSLADPSVFDLFSLPLRTGDPKSALSTLFSLVVTESLRYE